MSIKVKRTCQYCGDPFWVFPSRIRDGRGKFCSKECSWQGGNVDRVCQICGDHFRVSPSRIKRDEGKYCSQECFGKGLSLVLKGRKHTEESKRKMSLARVGQKRPPFSEEWKRKLGLARKGKPLSKEHRENIGLAHKGKTHPWQEGEGNHNWKGGKIKRSCEMCGKEFNYNRSDLKRGERRCCSLECAGKWRSKNIVKEKNPAWKGGITPIHLKLRSSSQYVDWRMKVFIRDGFTCQMCGDKHGGNIEAHHKKTFSVLIREARDCMPLLDPYSACILYTPMWDVSNGQTLCEDCHKEVER